MEKIKPGNSKTKAATNVAAPKVAAPPVRTPPLFRRIDWITFAVVTLLVFIGYYLTLAPELTLEDSGELAVASYYAGIPHPPGYPVWTLYTWLWTVLLPIGNIAWRVALAEATAGAVASGLLAMLVSRGSSMMIEGIAEFKNFDRRWENAICLISGFVAGLLLGFNGFMWSQSVIVEVYSFSLVSLMGVMICLLRWVYAPHQYRYLYLSFFLYGICFNNHQSLLVIAMAMEALVLVVQPKLAREMFFWNTIIYIGGLVLGAMGYVQVLTSNTPVLILYNVIGIASLGLWIWLITRTRMRMIEFGRDLIMLGAFLAVAIYLGSVTTYVTWFGNSTGSLMFLFVVAAGVVAVFWQAIKKTSHLPKEWLVALGCGGSWIVGAAFYLYMPLAGMTNPPMEWGYPRTVEGFFHALTRGQYDRIHPTAGVGSNIFEQTASFFTIYGKQMWMYLEGMNDEFSLVYLLIPLVVFLFYRRMQARERSWTIGIIAMFVILGPFLVFLLNPGLDRQSIELNRVFFTASHTMVAICIGYGLTLIMAAMATEYSRFRPLCLIGGGVAAVVALLSLAYNTPEFFGDQTYSNPILVIFHGLGSLPHYVALAFQKNQYALPFFADLIVLAIAIAFIAGIAIWRSRAPLALTLALFALMPVYSIMSHWADNEQRNHWFGYWFGHDMFTPPFTGPDGKLSYNPEERKQMMKDPAKTKLIYPEMARDAVLYGGTDPGRFCPTYMIFDESFIPPRCKPQDPNFDRRDVYIITQNALADGTYLDYIRAQYNRSTQIDPPFFQQLLRGPQELQDNYETNFIARMAYKLLDKPFTKLGAEIEARRRREGVYPPKEIYIATPDDSQRCFNEYISDAQRRYETHQLKPGENFSVKNGKVQVSGQVAVMAINGLLTKVMFDHNPTNEFYVEESFPLDWMYPHLTPFGVIMKINRNPLPTLPEDVLQRDHHFWAEYSDRLIGNWITYDTPVSNIVAFVQKVYLEHNYSGFKGDLKFVRDDQAQKAFSKLRSSIGGVYAWRISPQCPSEYRPKSTAEYQSISREADFAFKQAFAFCPYSPEAVFRYVNVLLQFNRLDDAMLVAKTCLKIDPNNAAAADLVRRLEDIKSRAGEFEKARSTIMAMENDVRAHPSNYQAALNLAGTYVQMQQTDRAIETLDRVLQDSNAPAGAMIALAQAYIQLEHKDRAEQALDRVLNDSNAAAPLIPMAAQYYAQLGNWPKLERALETLVKVRPNQPEAWYDLARLKASLGKSGEAIQALSRALQLNKARLARDPKATNLEITAREDAQFQTLRNLPEFQKLVSH